LYLAVCASIFIKNSQLEGENMSSASIITVAKMMEALPQKKQRQVEEHLRNYIQTMLDEEEWDTLTENTQPQLMAAARRAKKEIAEGKAEPMDLSRL
jgi:hypothetical protein